MDRSTIRKFRKTLRQFEREVGIQNNACTSCEISLSQCHALLALKEQGSVNLNELSCRLRLDNSTTSRIIDGLVRLGLVERTIPEENRRSVILNLTDTGQQICDTIHASNDSYFEQVFSGISDTDLYAFLFAFEKIASNMEEINQLNKA
ncbi:MAG: MarR family transcriptional regulator [Bacteroidia bacterium]|nr:MarR family transcriptional regulator [Bacteroidia bacterium]